MIETINYCFKNSKVASFYLNKEDNQVHLTGFIACYNESEILIAHITQRGEYDGYILNRIDSIYRIDYDGEYEKKIESLYKLKKQTHSEITCDEDGILFHLLAFAKENDFLISLELNNDKLTGLVYEYNDSICLNTINDNGIKSGVTIMNIDEIVTFSCDTDYEQDIKILYSNKIKD
jgi:hypothetical protein